MIAAAARSASSGGEAAASPARPGTALSCGAVARGRRIRAPIATATSTTASRRVIAARGSRIAWRASSPNGSTANAGVVTPLATYCPMCSRQCSGDPHTMSSSTSESGIDGQRALAVAVRPQLPHLGELVAPGRATRGTRRTPARSGRRRWRTCRSPSRCRGRRSGATKMRATISLSVAALAHVRRDTSTRRRRDSQLMMAPSPSRPARRSMPWPQRGDEDRGRLLGGATPRRKPLTLNGRRTSR